MKKIKLTKERMINGELKPVGFELEIPTASADAWIKEGWAEAVIEQ